MWGLFLFWTMFLNALSQGLFLHINEIIFTSSSIYGEIFGVLANSVVQYTELGASHNYWQTEKV